MLYKDITMKASAFRNLWTKAKHYENFYWETKLTGINGRLNINSQKLEPLYQSILDQSDADQCQFESFFEPYENNILEAIVKLTLIWNSNKKDWFISDILVINNDPFNDLTNPDNEDEDFITLSDVLKK